MLRVLVQSVLVFLLVQILAVAAGLTAARLSGSTQVGFVTSNIGAVAGVVVALRYYFANREARK